MARMGLVQLRPKVETNMKKAKTGGHEVSSSVRSRQECDDDPSGGTSDCDQSSSAGQ